MKYLSLFTGIGGFELGIQQVYEKTNKEKYPYECENCDYRWSFRGTDEKTLICSKCGSDRVTEVPVRPVCIGFSEIDKYAQEIYLKHFPNHHNFHDITKINEQTLPNFDFLCGGFPCQSFSIAGKRGGFEDTRGTLFFDIARILQVKQPRLLLLENVKGLLSHDNGRTFKTIISTLDELGYDLQWQVLNSKNFGVPQNRERVFIVGHLRGTSRPEVFPITRGNPKNLEQLNQGESQGYRVYGVEGVAPTQASQAGGVGAKTGLIAHTVRAGGKSSGFGTKQNWDSYLVDGQIRRLTPTECERLQGFPDGWTEGISDTQRYKCLGNAVTVNVIQAIVEKML